MKIPFDYHDRKSCKQSRSRSSQRKTYKRSWSHSIKSPLDHDAEKYCKRLKSKKDTIEVDHDLGKVHVTMVLKNVINNRGQSHQ